MMNPATVMPICSMRFNRALIDSYLISQTASCELTRTSSSDAVAIHPSFLFGYIFRLFHFRNLVIRQLERSG
jgi:hypothetical protein